MASCNHPIHVGGMCAVCGALLSDAQQSQSISMMHDTESVTVSRQEAQRLDSESTRHLLDQRKLALIVDLDQTIIHATVDPTVGEWLKSPENPNYEALKGVGTFRLGMDGKAVLEDGTGVGPRSSSSTTPKPTTTDDEGCWYYVKPRPGLADFLRSLSERYELHVYTMGTRSYADCVCKLVDPDGSLFGTRILSRDENGSLVQKSLTRLFPMDTSMVVIIDDRGDVWSWSPNLVKVIPYDFFIGSGDINATFLPAAPGPAATGPPPSDGSSSSANPLPAASSSDAAIAPTPSPPSSQSSTEDQAASATTEQLNDAAEKEEKAADNAAKAKAEESQKSAVTEQLGSRPLAKMQERLDEELGVTPTPSEIGAEDAQGLLDGGESSSASSATPTSGEGAASKSPSPLSPATSASSATPAVEAPGPPPAKPQQAGPQRPHAILKNDDVELQRVQKILDSIHQRWYEQWDANEESSKTEKGTVAGDSSTLVKPTVMDIIADLKKEVLRDCDIVFSSLIPLGGSIEDSDYFWLACEYGASCSEKLKPDTTHLIAAKGGTAKVNAAQARGHVEVVWPNWLHDTVAKWERQPEMYYRLPRAPPDAEPLSSEQPTDDELLTSSDEEVDLVGGEADDVASIGPGKDGVDWAGPGGTLAGVNWAEADKELEEYLNGSDGDEEDLGSEDGDVSVAGYTTDGSVSRTPSRRGKRSRISTPSVNGDVIKQALNGTSGSSKAASLVRSASSTSNPNGKRRRVASDKHSDAEDTDGERLPPTARLGGRVSGSGTGGASSRSGTPAGDETGASFMQDLEDEIEAAMGAVSDVGEGDDEGVKADGFEDEEDAREAGVSEGFETAGVRAD